MAMSRIWAALVAASVLFGAINGKLDAVGAAALAGAQEAITLAISLAGVLCLWSGVLEVMKRAGLSAGLARLCGPLLRRLFPETAKNPEAMGALSANVSANLLGLGNAATPLGIKAAQLMHRGGAASNDLCMFVVLNTASIQLIPATTAALRGSLGAAAPFDILPAVWLTSIVALCAGITAAKLLEKKKA